VDAARIPACGGLAGAPAAIHRVTPAVRRVFDDPRQRALSRRRPARDIDEHRGGRGVGGSDGPGTNGSAQT